MKKIIAIIGFLSLAGSSFSLANAGYFNYEPAFQCEVSITSQLQVGSQGGEVYTLQDFLARSGYLNAEPNGYFGQSTKSAVRSFQRDNYISMTGTVGPQTRNALNERLCDNNVRVDTYGYNEYDYYGQNSGVTRVDSYDPYAIVMLPKPTQAVIYQTPGNTSVPVSPAYSQYAQAEELAYVSPVNPSIAINTVDAVPSVSAISPQSNQIASTQITYNPFTGYTYGITPRTGTLTVTSPVPNTVFREGNTVNVSWVTNNINASGYRVSLENTSGGQSRFVASSNGNSASFVLTREILDSVCSGDCISYGKTSYRIVISTPVTDIAGQTSTFKASVSPIIIDRPLGLGTVSITASQSPVNSGEGFRLYVNIPTGASWDANLYGQYSFTIRALCPAGVSASVAGSSCGQEFSLPFTPTALQQSIPVMLTNTAWFSRQTSFELVVKNNLGQIIGTAQTNVTVNGQPFNW
jgi:peptidoglycan hydrolase-like protein with peptidoglycan-binding domain